MWFVINTIQAGRYWFKYFGNQAQNFRYPYDFRNFEFVHVVIAYPINK